MTFLFDIGNVLLHVDFRPSLARILPDPPVDIETRMAELMRRKDELESGRISSGEFVDDAIERLGYTGSRDGFLAAWCNVFEPVEPMWRTVGKLATDGHRLILFSNTNDLHMDDALRRYEIFRHFPEAVFSHEVGAMKPDEAIYRHAIDRHGIVPGDTIYIDDLAENIATGRRLGFRSWRYDAADHAAFLGWLDRELAGG